MYPKIVTEQQWHKDLTSLHREIQAMYKKLEDEKLEEKFKPLKAKHKVALDKLDAEYKKGIRNFLKVI